MGKNFWCWMLIGLKILFPTTYVYLIFTEHYLFGTLFFFVSMLYIIGIFLFKYCITKDFRKAKILYLKHRYEESLEMYRKCYDFFDKHRFLDKWIYTMALSEDRTSVRERVLHNITVIYVRIGDMKKVKEQNQKALQLFPENVRSQGLRNLICSIEDGVRQ